MIIKRITWFGRCGLWFKIYACFISSSLCGANNVFRVIDLLFVSNFFKSFASEEKSISFQALLVYERFCLCCSLWICFDLLMVQCSSYGILKILTFIIIWIYYCFFLFLFRFRRIYVSPTTSKAYLMTLIM